MRMFSAPLDLGAAENEIVNGWRQIRILDEICTGTGDTELAPIWIDSDDTFGPMWCWILQNPVECALDIVWVLENSRVKSGSHNRPQRHCFKIHDVRIDSWTLDPLLESWVDIICLIARIQLGGQADITTQAWDLLHDLLGIWFVLAFRLHRSVYLARSHETVVSDAEICSHFSFIRRVRVWSIDALESCQLLGPAGRWTTTYHLESTSVRSTNNDMAAKNIEQRLVRIDHISVGRIPSLQIEARDGGGESILINRLSIRLEFDICNILVVAEQRVRSILLEWLIDRVTDRCVTRDGHVLRRQWRISLESLGCRGSVLPWVERSCVGDQCQQDSTIVWRVLQELDATSTATFTLSGLFHLALATSTTEVVEHIGMRAYVVMIASVTYDSFVSSFQRTCTFGLTALMSLGPTAVRSMPYPSQDEGGKSLSPTFFLWKFLLLCEWVMMVQFFDSSLENRWNCWTCWAC